MATPLDSSIVVAMQTELRQFPDPLNPPVSEPPLGPASPDVPLREPDPSPNPDVPVREPDPEDPNQI
jgi:hypothetical protein